MPRYPVQQRSNDIGIVFPPERDGDDALLVQQLVERDLAARRGQADSLYGERGMFSWWQDLVTVAEESVPFDIDLVHGQRHARQKIDHRGIAPCQSLGGIRCGGAVGQISPRPSVLS